MFKNREVAIKIQKAGAKTEDGETNKKFELPWDEMQNAGNSIKRSLKKTAALGVLAFYGYILLDTGRKVAIARAENHHDN